MPLFQGLGRGEVKNKTSLLRHTWKPHGPNANLGSGVSGAIRMACGAGYQHHVHNELQARKGRPMEPGDRSRDLHALGLPWLDGTMTFG